ncbi:MAG: hypothetical protein OSB30_05765 [Candidatus Poseidoniaceae archaeon]|nr:hypothetical protein [Candidatus Poseidoniaceae archaeon]
MDNRRLLALLATLLLISTVISPAMAEMETINPQSINQQQELQQLESKATIAGQQLVATTLNEITPRSSSNTGARAACPLVQTDAGANGDAGNSANTSRSLGTNPNSGQTGNQGCMDANDADDWYEVAITSGKDTDVELVVPAGTDFDLYLIDGVGNIADSSVISDPLEKVSTLGTSLSGIAGTFYIQLSVWSGDGQYTLRTWTNDSPPMPDLTISNVIGPSSGQAGQTVDVNYTVSNQWNASSGAFESQFILSADQIYNWGDVLISESQSETDLAENSSRNMNSQVIIPSSTANGTYYWIVWADGYGNLSEKSENNNNNVSVNQMLIGESCQDRHPNGLDDAGLGSDAPNNTNSVVAPLGNNVTSQYTGCIDGLDANDVFSFDVPANHSIEIEITRHKSSTLDAELTLGNNLVDSGFGWGNNTLKTTTLGTMFDGTGGTYFVNMSSTEDAVDWTMYVWTNYSTPLPDLIISEVSGPLNAAAGNPISIDVIINNTGTSGALSPLVSVFLSVDDEFADHDIEIGNLSAGFIDANQSQLVQIQATIPAGLQGGNYSLIAVVDYDEQIVEKSEENNIGFAVDQLLVDTMATSCSSQDDAASGNDAGADMASSYDLGSDTSITITGCIDEGVDDEDWYKITLTAGLNLSALMINAPDSDFDVYLRDDVGEWFDRPYFGGPADEEVTTIDDPNFAGSGGVFYISVEVFTGVGIYTLIIETEGVDPDTFNCGQQNDLNLGQDAPASSGILLGDDPTISGQGCMSGTDESDSFSFTVTQNSNTEVTFNADSELAFVAWIEDPSGNILNQVDNTTFGTLFTTIDSENEGIQQTYKIIVESNGDVGVYNISITDMGSAPADLVIDSLICPINHTSGSEVQFSWQLTNLRGPAEGASITVHLDMLNETGEDVMRMFTSSVIVSGQYNITAFDARSEFFNTPDELTTGNYSCRLTIDVNDAVAESNESNNVMIGNTFFIQNEEELWANDVDRDGYNTTDTGDGLVDDCPTSYGESIIDRYGCADVDGDGVSNLNDLWPLDASQAVDSDGDSYGDNTAGTDGDYCPEVAGVANGDGGQGCPIAIVDSDSDGVIDQDDLCPNSIVGTTVDEDGCEIDNSATNNTTNNTGNQNTNTTDNGTTNQGNNGNNEVVDTDDEEGDAASSSVLGLSPTILGGLVGLVLILLLILGFTMRGGNKNASDESYVNAQFAAQDLAYSGYGQQQAPAVALDPSITAEQLAYEQQLTAAGYPADYARQYADQHFRPWLTQR